MAERILEPGVLRLKSPMHAETRTDCIRRWEKGLNVDCITLPKPRRHYREVSPSLCSSSGETAPRKRWVTWQEPLFLFWPSHPTPGIAEASARLSHWKLDWTDRGRGLEAIPAQAVIPMGSFAFLQNRAGSVLWSGNLGSRSIWCGSEAKYPPAHNMFPSTPTPLVWERNQILRIFSFYFSINCLKE